LVPEQRPQLGVANGRSDGVGTGIPPDELALTFSGPDDARAMLVTQASTPQIVARLERNERSYDRHTTGLPELDGAPGSTLDSLAMVADVLANVGEVEKLVPPVCFIPTASAVSLRDVTDHASLYDPIRRDEKGDLDAFRCASENQAHVLITEELCGWILDRLAE
jgi:hypothetical protein